MSKTMLKKEKWTLSFDSSLKHLVVAEARKKGIYPVSFLEEIVRDRFSLYGHSDVKNAKSYISEIRKKSRNTSDGKFLKELNPWQKSNS